MITIVSILFWKIWEISSAHSNQIDTSQNIIFQLECPLNEPSANFVKEVPFMFYDAQITRI